MHTIGKWLLITLAAWPAVNMQSATIAGRAVRADDGAPIRFVSVVAVSADSAISRTSTGDRDGNFAFAELPAGWYSIRASAPGYATIDASLVVPQAERRA